MPARHLGDWKANVLQLPLSLKQELQGLGLFFVLFLIFRGETAFQANLHLKTQVSRLSKHEKLRPVRLAPLNFQPGGCEDLRWSLASSLAAVLWTFLENVFPWGTRQDAVLNRQKMLLPKTLTPHVDQRTTKSNLKGWHLCLHFGPDSLIVCLLLHRSVLIALKLCLWRIHWYLPNIFSLQGWRNRQRELGTVSYFTISCSGFLNALELLR